MRILAIINNPGLTPNHRQELLTKLRWEGLMVRNARIASDHIELDVLVNDEREVRLVERLGLNLQEVRVIDMERTINYDVHDALFKYVELFNKERFCCPVSLMSACLIILHLLSGLAPMLGASTFSAHGAGSWTTPFTGFPSGRRSLSKPT